ncbi:MAG: hypothetical protein J7J43_06690 [Thermosipho sp. (in: Bacteria)]|nr:hypothetical protein [Thermosipho sp. (in: thermotogales)]
MRKLVIILISIILFLFPLFFYLIDKYQAVNEFKDFKMILEDNIKSYDALINELIKFKDPDGYVVENNKLYYKGNIVEVKKINNGYAVIKLLSDEYELFYINNSKIYKIPKIKSNFILYDSNKKIITENNFSKEIESIFPNVKNNNITFYMGKKVYFEKVSFDNGLSAIVFVNVPTQHLLLYFLFVPLGVLFLFEFGIFEKIKSSKKGDK